MSNRTPKSQFIAVILTLPSSLPIDGLRSRPRVSSSEISRGGRNPLLAYYIHYRYDWDTLTPATFSANN
eukprot:IDg9549t1